MVRIAPINVQTIYGYVEGNPVSYSDPEDLYPAETHPATDSEWENILKAANAIKDKGLTHEQIQCNHNKTTCLLNWIVLA